MRTTFSSLRQKEIPLESGGKENDLAFGKKKNIQSKAECENVVQTKRNEHPYLCLSDYFPSHKGEMKLYESVKEAVPIIGAAIDKLTRLIGTFDIVCADEEAQSQINTFLKNIKVGASSLGMNSFISEYFSSLLTYGTAVGEIVTDGVEITALYNTDIKDVELSFSDDRLSVIISAGDGYGEYTPVKYPSLVFVSTIGQKTDSPYGTSILKGLPYISDILLKIYNTIGTNWDRAGNVRYAVTYKPQNDSSDKAFAKQRAQQVAEQWGKTMQSGGPVRDFVAVGDVDIKVIGADSVIPDSEIPVRQMLEQIVAKLGVPPFLLGLSWSSTERMSALQADILTSEIDYYREILNPVIAKICRMFFALSGKETDFDIEWNNITLQDSLSLAQTNYYNAQAMSLLKEDENGK